MKQNYKHGGPQDELDRLLDCALAQYTAVEPRPGVEDRVLATLRAEATLPARHAWWRGGVAAAVAAVLVIAVALAFRSERSSRPVIVREAPVPEKVPPELRHNDEAVRESSQSARGQERTKSHSRRATHEVAVNPKLDVFPSPRPLSDQERMLSRFVAENPERAALVAEARTNAIRLELEERTAIANQFDSQR